MTDRTGGSVSAVLDGPDAASAPAELAGAGAVGGGIADERAGYPALSFVGYDPTARTIEYAGFCTDTDIAKGGPGPRHVLIREIHELCALVKTKEGSRRPSCRYRAGRVRRRVAATIAWWGDGDVPSGDGWLGCSGDALRAEKVAVGLVSARRPSLRDEAG